MAVKYISVSAYAKENNITRQAVYKKIDNGLLKVVVRNGVKCIAIKEQKQSEKSDPKFESNETTTELVNLLKQQLEQKDSQINDLTKLLQLKEMQLASAQEQVKQLTYKPTLTEKIKNIFTKQDN